MYFSLVLHIMKLIREWFLSLDNFETETGQRLPRTYKLEETSYDGGQDDLEAKMTQVIQRSNEWADKIQLGAFYQNEHIHTYKERIATRIHNYMEIPQNKPSKIKVIAP